MSYKSLFVSFQIGRAISELQNFYISRVISDKFV